MKPYYADDFVTIYHGDCRQVLPSLRDVQTTVTSPPYATLQGRNAGARIGQGGERSYSHRVAQKIERVGYVDSYAEGAYERLLLDVQRLVAASSTPDASFFLNLKLHYRLSEPLHPLRTVDQFGAWLLRQEVVWDRGLSMSFGSKMFAPSDERIYWMVRDRANYHWTQPAKNPMSVWRVRPEMADHDHPCPFPVDLPQLCIAATTSPGDLVLDPFVGSGPTLLAAKSLGRKAIGVEINERYCEMAARRCSQEVLDLEAA